MPNKQEPALIVEIDGQRHLLDVRAVRRAMGYRHWMGRHLSLTFYSYPKTVFVAKNHE